MNAPAYLRQFEFLVLPTEVRLMVYKCLLSRQVGVIACPEVCKHVPRLRATEDQLREHPCLSTGKYFQEFPVDYHHLHNQHEIQTSSALGLARLLQTCRTVFSELIPLFGSTLAFNIATLELGCWFGTRISLTAPHIKDLALGGAPDQGLANNQKRWLKVLLKRFSNLERLVMKLDRRADPSIIGTKWQVDELRKMKIVLENSQMKMVFSVPPCCCMCLTPVLFSKDPPNLSGCAAGTGRYRF